MLLVLSGWGVALGCPLMIAKPIDCYVLVQPDYPPTRVRKPKDSWSQNSSGRPIGQGLGKGRWIP